MPSTFYTKTEWKRLRLKAIRRDRWRCVQCKQSVSAPGAAFVDHIVGRKDAPNLAMEIDNLETLCRACSESTKPLRKPTIDVGAIDNL